MKNEGWMTVNRADPCPDRARGRQVDIRFGDTTYLGIDSRKVIWSGVDYWRPTTVSRGTGPKWSSLFSPRVTEPVPEAPREGDQVAPTPNSNPPVWPLVMVDMASRDQLGRKRYGTPLQAHNGRDTLRDAYEEALDLAVYLRAAIYEREGK